MPSNQVARLGIEHLAVLVHLKNPSTLAGEVVFSPVNNTTVSRDFNPPAKTVYPATWSHPMSDLGDV